MHKPKLFLFLISTAYYLPLAGQALHGDLDLILQRQVEAYVLNTENQNFDFQDIIDHYRQLLKQPININSSTGTTSPVAIARGSVGEQCTVKVDRSRL